MVPGSLGPDGSPPGSPRDEMSMPPAAVFISHPLTEMRLYQQRQATVRRHRSDWISGEKDVFQPLLPNKNAKNGNRAMARPTIPFEATKLLKYLYPSPRFFPGFPQEHCVVLSFIYAPLKGPSREFFSDQRIAYHAPKG